MRKLNYKNNWQNDNYFAGNDLISDLRGVYFNGQFHDVKSKLVSVDYYDSGHKYKATSKHYFISINDPILNKPTLVDLNKYLDKIDIYATEYTLQKHT